jgi:hypothetical protein
VAEKKTSDTTALAEARSLADRLTAILNAQKPTKAQMAELEQALEDAPAMVRLFGDMGKQVQYRIIDRLAAVQPGTRLLLRRRIDQLANELGWATASPLERLQIDVVVAAWLRWVHTEYQFSAVMEEGSVTLTRAEHWEKRLAAAHSRYLRAVESYARVRALLRRAPVQVNIAQQQIVANG